MTLNSLMIIEQDISNNTLTYFSFLVRGQRLILHGSWSFRPNWHFITFWWQTYKMRMILMNDTTSGFIIYLPTQFNLYFILILLH